MAQQLNSLKTINNIQRDGSLQDLLLSIKDAKAQVEAFSNAVTDRKNKLVAIAKAEQLEKEKALQQQKVEAEPQVEIKEAKKIFSQGSNQNNGYRKFDGQNGRNGNGGRFDGNRQFGEKRNFSQNGKPNMQNGGKFGQRPNQNPNFVKNGQNGGKMGGFVSTRANNFKTFGGATESSSVLATPERNFGNKNKQRRNVEDNKKQSSRAKSSFAKSNNILVMDGDGFDEEYMGSRKLIRKKKDVAVSVAPQVTHALISSNEISVKELSEKIGKPVAEIVKKLMLLGVMATINSSIDFDTCELVASELGVTLELKLDKTYEEKPQDIPHRSYDIK